MMLLSAEKLREGADAGDPYLAQRRSIYVAPLPLSGERKIKRVDTGITSASLLRSSRSSGSSDSDEKVRGKQKQKHKPRRPEEGNSSSRPTVNRNQADRTKARKSDAPGEKCEARMEKRAAEQSRTAPQTTENDSMVPRSEAQSTAQAASNSRREKLRDFSGAPPQSALIKSHIRKVFTMYRSEDSDNEEDIETVTRAKAMQLMQAVSALMKRGRGGLKMKETSSVVSMLSFIAQRGMHDARVHTLALESLLCVLKIRRARPFDGDKNLIESLWPSVLNFLVHDALQFEPDICPPSSSSEDKRDLAAPRLAISLKLMTVVKGWCEASAASEFWFVNRGCLHVLGYLASFMQDLPTESFRLLRQHVYEWSPKELRVLVTPPVDPFAGSSLYDQMSGKINSGANRFAQEELGKRKRAKMKSSAPLRKSGDGISDAERKRRAQEWAQSFEKENAEKRKKASKRRQSLREEQLRIEMEQERAEKEEKERRRGEIALKRERLNKDRKRKAARRKKMEQEELKEQARFNDERKALAKVAIEQWLTSKKQKEKKEHRKETRGEEIEAAFK